MDSPVQGSWGSSRFFQVLAQKQPNILWIITDDQRADALACYNRATTGESESYLGYVMSPNADKLAEEGTMFVNAYAVLVFGTNGSQEFPIVSDSMLLLYKKI